MALSHNFLSVLGRDIDYLVPRLNQVHLISGLFFIRPLQKVRLKCTVLMEKSLQRLDAYRVPALKISPCLPWLIFISMEVSYIVPKIYNYKYSFNVSLMQVVVYN